MAEEASSEGGTGTRRARSSSSSSRGAAAGAQSPTSPSTSGRRPAEGNNSKDWRRSGGGGGEHHHRRPSRFSRKWSARILHARHWAEQQPALQYIRNNLLRFIHHFLPLITQLRARGDSISERFWPPVRDGALLVARVLLIITLASLECCLRGFNSLFRLSSAAVCLTFWCGLLCLTALAGFVSVIAVSLVTIAVSFFLGLIPGSIVLGLFGAVVLWLHGSFWVTSAVISIAGALMFLERGRFAGGAIVVIYSIYSCKVHGGWLGLTLCVGLSFVSSDLVILFLTSIEERRQSEKLYERTHHHKSQQQAPSAEDEANFSATGVSEVDPTSAGEEAARILGCSDHYAVLKVARFEPCDEALLKKEYRKKAMLVHPDKNKGNPTAEEAFKRLQNAYEVLMDTEKKKCYDDDLRREQLIMNFRRNGFGLHPNGRCESPDCSCHSQQRQEEDIEIVDARPIVCKNCRQLHMWMRTDRIKQLARWCQDCQEFHAAKDGDGWVEQSYQPFFFGLFQKVDTPEAYACSEGLIFNVTDWAICQGMKCPPNTHKPSFYVSTGAAGASSQGNSSRSKKKGNVADGFSFPDIDENMSEQEFFEWLETAVASGLFEGMNQQQHQDHHNHQHQQQQQQASSSSNHNKHKKKKKGGNRKQW